MEKHHTASKHSGGQSGQGQATHKAGGKSSAAGRTANRREPVEDSRLLEFFVDELKDIYWAERSW